MKDIRTITVLGANGTMGSNVAGIFASFGNAKVYLVCRSLQDSKNAKNRAAKSVRAEAIEKNLLARTYDDLEDCISNSDLVFESIAENINIKKQVYSLILKYIKPNTIIGTGTSGLSINELSECFDENIKENYMGIHMYNPPYNMTLCEVVPSRYTNKEVLKDVKVYLKNILYRNVVEVKDVPAFMGNRIGFQFINEALQYAEMYRENGGIDYIDSILGGFTGRSMSPLVTSDFVGLDVHKAIVDNIYNNSKDYAHDTFIMPKFAENLIKENKLGRKTGCGLYRAATNVEGIRTIQVYDIANGNFRNKKKYKFYFAEQMIKKFEVGNYNDAFKILIEDGSIESNICIQFMMKYVIYSLVTTKFIGENIHSADDVMATGFNWVPPLAIIDAFGGIDSFKEILFNKMDKKFLSKMDINEVLKNVPKSKYDFRPFFKAK